jgi:hypothetical protein
MSPTRAAANKRRPATIIALLAILTAIGSITARAEVLVEGNATALRVYARESQVAEVLSALGGMQVRVRTSIALDKVVSGTYSGSLRQVLARVPRRSLAAEWRSPIDLNAPARK